MQVRLITGSAIALLLLCGTAATAGPRLGMAHEPHRLEVRKVGGLFGLFGGDSEEKPDKGGSSVEFAQAGDPRVPQLEEEIRKLSGTVEELNFQVLQMQEQLRKMQEDNEFRLQELEKGGGSAGASNKKSDAVTPAKSKDDAGTPRGSNETAATVLPDNGGGQDNSTAMPGVEIGTITVDKDGNVQGATLGQPLDQGTGAAVPSDNTTVAALPSTDDPDELYRNAYEFILSGDYPTAEAGFRDHISRFPADPRASDAHYWLGEAMLGQKKYRDAAEVFLASNRDYPDSAKAPDMLLKLGVSLKQLNQHEVACATFKEVGKRYPRASDALKQRVKQEQAMAGC